MGAVLGLCSAAQVRISWKIEIAKKRRNFPTPFLFAFHNILQFPLHILKFLYLIQLSLVLMSPVYWELRNHGGDS